MTEPVLAGQLIADSMRACSPVELRVISRACKHHRDASSSRGALQLASLWSVLAIAADAVLSEHPNALTDVDHDDLDSLGDTDETP